LLPAEHQIVEVSPNPEWNWVPSNVWVGVGQMAEKEVTFDLAEIYKKNQDRL
jgi:sulfide:quinone oxidoreductase